MSLSRYFPPSTQAILSAQCSPPPAKKRRDKSIIVISSSPEDNTLQQPLESPQRIFCSDDEEFFGPVRSNSPAPPRLAGKQSRQIVETPPLDVEDETFSQLLGEYKYTQSRPLTDTANIPRPRLQKVNLDGFFQETKLTATKPPLHGKSRVKTTLTTRVSLPKRPIPTNTTEPTAKPASESTPHASSREHVRFFTSWAAAQAPTTRAKPTAKPRRKAMRKRDSVEVVLLSPRTGQESVRERAVVHEIGERKLGEKGDGGSVMWDACKRGLDGELYDCEGGMVFSQELRQSVCDDEQEEGSLSVESGDVEVFELTDNQENCPSRNEEMTTALDMENRQRNNKMVIVEDTDTSLNIPLRHLTPPCPDLPLEITSQFDQSLEIIDITDLPPNQHHPQPTPTIPLPTLDSPLPIRPKSKQPVAPQSDPFPNYSTYTLPQLQSEVKKYGFKPSKSKPAMIALLHQCHAAAVATPAPSKPPVQDLSSPALVARLHARITETIKTDEGGWYARILRYEPVVVEELVEWFEGRGMEVGEVVLRGWCDKEGICCVGRESLGGRRRARY